jgi:hypothetical protein
MIVEMISFHLAMLVVIMLGQIAFQNFDIEFVSIVLPGNSDKNTTGGDYRGTL